jgi:hypothetical protein
MDDFDIALSAMKKESFDLLHLFTVARGYSPRI